MLRRTLLVGNQGKVVSWMASRGFGFIEDNADKKQHFVHFSALQIVPGGFRSLQPNQEVQFEVNSQDGRTRAENVTSIGGEPLPSGPRPPEGTGDRGGRGGGFRGGRGGGFRGRGGRGGFQNNERHQNDSLGSSDF